MKKSKKVEKEITSNRKHAGYLTIKKTTEIEECYRVEQCSLTIAELEKFLSEGELNIVQLETVEPYKWLVDSSGQRLGILHKDGGSSSGPHCEVKAS
jgi:predicted oxidoreductase